MTKKQPAYTDKLPSGWTSADRAKLFNTAEDRLTTEYPDYSKRQLIHWKRVLKQERDTKLEKFREGKLSDHETALWVSKAELTRRKRQEYNEAMGTVADVLADPDGPQKAAHFLTKLAADENAYVSQRTARSISLATARELLLWQHVDVRMDALASRIAARPRGYARRKAPSGDARRVLSQLWTDHHNGAALPSDELPVGYDETKQRRRFAHVLANAIEYKRDHRKYTHAYVYDAGDNMEGFLAHDLRSGEPLADQFVTTLEYRIQATEHLAAEFPEVHIWVKPGNHDRNKMRHPGRATFQKWDSYQTMLGHAWQRACRHLPNVKFHVDKRPYAAVQVLGHWTFVTHGDTMLNAGNPGKKVHVDKIVAQMDSINATGRYGGPFRVFAMGHVHTSVQLEISGADLFINSALCPSSGYSDALGYYTNCSQWLWETTEKYAVGDMRRIRVGVEQDNDATLDDVIRPVDIWPAA